MTAFHCGVGKVPQEETTSLIHPVPRPCRKGVKSFKRPAVLARASLHREGAFYRAKHKPKFEKLGPGACKFALVGKVSQAVLKGHHVWLQVCDGDSREKLTSRFPFGLLSFGSLQLKMSRKAAHTLVHMV